MGDIETSFNKNTVLHRNIGIFILYTDILISWSLFSCQGHIWSFSEDAWLRKMLTYSYRFKFLPFKITLLTRSCSFKLLKFSGIVTII